MLKVKFVDYWVDLNTAKNNHFYDLLSKKYDIEFSDDPDILFYSNFGKEHLKYKCIRVFLTGENIRPDFTACDYAVTFDYSNDPRHFRFPLWAFYYMAYLRWKWTDVPELDTEDQPERLIAQWKKKTKFCCFIVSNPICEKRNNFFLKLNEAMPVDSAGKYLNNVGFLLEGGTAEKMSFIEQYKFVISFENTAYPGYTTEKILEPLLAGCIPIYWGDPSVTKEFNPLRFVNYIDFENEDKVIEQVLKINNDPELAFSMLKENCFTNGPKAVEQLENGLTDFLSNIIDNRHTITPVSQKIMFTILHVCKAFTQKYTQKVKNKIKSISKQH